MSVMPQNCIIIIIEYFVMDNMSDRAFKRQEINNVNKKIFACFRRYMKIQNKHKLIFATVVTCSGYFNSFTFSTAQQYSLRFFWYKIHLHEQ